MDVGPCVGTLSTEPGLEVAQTQAPNLNAST